MTMMLECNLELLVGCFCLQTGKSMHISSHETRVHRLAQGLQATHLVLLSYTSVDWSEPENIYFLSHDIWSVLYLVIFNFFLYGGNEKKKKHFTFYDTNLVVEA